MNVSTPSNYNTPVSFINFRDGSRLTSAKEVQDFHVAKKLKVSNEANFSNDVDILGDLTVHGNVSIDLDLTESAKAYIDGELADVFLLLGWDNTLQKWIYSDQTNSITTNLDARINEINFQDYYTKDQTDAQILSGDTLSFVYYDGVSSIYHGNEGEEYNHSCTTVASGNHFIIPHSTSGLFIIQNSTYGVGKVLTSDANGHATWETPVSVTPTIQSIITSNGQSDTASLEIKDTISQTFEFLPNKIGNDYEIAQTGDAVLKVSSGAFTLSSGTTTAINRPCGIRMNFSDTTGSLALFGGSQLDDTNTTVWKTTGSVYNGYRLGNSIQLDQYGINIVHDLNLGINLYGHVNILQKSPSHPPTNFNTNIINPAFTVGDTTNGGNIMIYGNITASSIKLTNGAHLNYVLTSLGDGTAEWLPTQATAIVSTFTDDVDMVNLDVSNLLTTADIHVPDILSIKSNSSSSDATVSFIDTMTPTSSTSWWTESGIIALGFNTHLLYFNGSTTTELVKDQNYSSSDILIQVANVTVPPNYYKSIEFTVPVYLQHQFTNKNSIYTNEPQNNFHTYWINRCELKADYQLENGNWSFLSTFNYNDNGRQGMGVVTIEGDRHRDQYTDTRQTLTQYNFELDRIQVRFLPPVSHLSTSYKLYLNLSIGYHYTGASLWNTVPDYVNSRYTNMSISLFNYTEYLTWFHPDDLTWVYRFASQSNEHPGTFFVQYYNPFYAEPYSDTSFAPLNIHFYDTSKSRTIKWYNAKDIFKNILVVPAGAQIEEVNSINPPKIISTPSYTQRIHYTSYQSLSTKLIRLGRLYVSELFVRGNIECTGGIKAIGVMGRRGTSTAISNELNIGQVNQGNIQNNSVFNFFWTGTKIETWVDSTLVLSIDPNYSDHRIKIHIEDLHDENVLDRICSINIFKYTRQSQSLSTSDGHIGFYAHDLQSTFPEFKNLVDGEKDAVYKNGKPRYQTINYDELTVLLFKGIQELEQKMTKCKKINREIANRMDYLISGIIVITCLTICLITWKSFFSSSFSSACCYLIHQQK